MSKEPMSKVPNATGRPRLGLICGTFNPIHVGHLLIAESARDQFSLAQVIFVTSPTPPHRLGEKDLLPGADRHEMVASAVSDNPNFKASTAELERSGPSYTIDTIEHFQALHKDAELALIIGGDNLADLSTWHRGDEILARCLILVAPRLVTAERAKECTHGKQSSSSSVLAEYSFEHPDTEVWPKARIGVIDLPAVSISSSSIRSRIAQNQSILYMVPNRVLEILERKQHYRVNGP